jgi:lipopolysaccharide/colanic/teichoic acid biosynthesis glycosyltransferase
MLFIDGLVSYDVRRHRDFDTFCVRNIYEYSTLFLPFKFWLFVICSVNRMIAIALKNAKSADIKEGIIPSRFVVTAFRRLLKSFLIRNRLIDTAVQNNDHITELIFVTWPTAVLILMLVSRGTISRWLCHLGPRGALHKSVALFRPEPSRATLTAQVEGSACIVRTFEPKLREKHNSSNLQQLLDLGRENAVDSVLIAVEARNENGITALIERLRLLRVEVAMCQSHAATSLLLQNESKIGDSYCSVAAGLPISRCDFLIKSFIAKFGAQAVLLLFFPLLLFFASLTTLNIQAPIIFRQERRGWCGNQFIITKFHTMHEPSYGTKWFTQTEGNDVRGTLLGSFLPRTSLDDLVLLPRPIKCAMGYNMTYYIEHWSLRLVLRILASTPICLIRENIN